MNPKEQYQRREDGTRARNPEVFPKKYLWCKVWRRNLKPKGKRLTPTYLQVH